MNTYIYIYDFDKVCCMGGFCIEREREKERESAREIERERGLVHVFEREIQRDMCWIGGSCIHWTQVKILPNQLATKCTGEKKLYSRLCFF